MKTYKDFIDDLNESRSYTHDVYDVKNIIKRWLWSYKLDYDIKINDDRLDFQLSINNDEYFDKEKFNIIVTMCQNMGYFPSVIYLDNKNLLEDYKEYCNFKNTICNNKKDIDYIDFIQSLELSDFNQLNIQFERYIDSDINPKTIPDIIYHVCRTIDVNDILKYGLQPKSKSKLSYHPDRIYLTKIGAESIVNQFKKINDEDYSILEISLDNNTKEYLNLKKDPNFNDVYYTLINISPNKIKLK